MDRERVIKVRDEMLISIKDYLQTLEDEDAWSMYYDIIIPNTEFMLSDQYEPKTGRELRTMVRRLELDTVLRFILGSSNVYFDPPESQKMSYPCIRYERVNGKTEFADNRPYSYTRRYLLTVIDRDPDSVIPDEIATLPMCTHDRDFTGDNLHHYVFTLYY